jgi:pre-mRNA-processing factor 8
MPTTMSQQASSSKMPPEVLAQKSQKWIQMQNKRYGERRKGGYIDIGKQVCEPSVYDA